VQIVQSGLEHNVGKLGESYLWMVDYRSSTIDGDVRGATMVPKTLEHILRWMFEVTHWNAVFKLAPNDYATDIGTMLIAFNGSDKIIIQEGTYTFSRQSSFVKTSIVHETLFLMHWRFVVFDAVLDKIGLASKCFSQ
jgi:hypothetical protein